METLRLHWHYWESKGKRKKKRKKKTSFWCREHFLLRENVPLEKGETCHFFHRRFKHFFFCRSAINHPAVQSKWSACTCRLKEKEQKKKKKKKKKKKRKRRTEKEEKEEKEEEEEKEEKEEKEKEQKKKKKKKMNRKRRKRKRRRTKKKKKKKNKKKKKKEKKKNRKLNLATDGFSPVILIESYQHLTFHADEAFPTSTFSRPLAPTGRSERQFRNVKFEKLGVKELNGGFMYAGMAPRVRDWVGGGVKSKFDQLASVNVEV